MVTPGFVLNVPIKYFLLGSYVEKYTNDNIILTLNPSTNLKSSFNQFDELITESNKKNSQSFS